MKLIKYCITFVFVLTLQGCGSNNSDSADVSDGYLAVADVPAYIADFERLSDKVRINYDGQESALSLIEADEEDGTVVMGFDTGVLLLSVNSENLKPDGSVSVWEGDPQAIKQAVAGNSEELEAVVTNILSGDGLIVSGDTDEGYTIQGSIATEDMSLSRMLTVHFNESVISAGSSQLEVAGDRAILNGDLGSRTYVQIRDLLAGHPEVKTLVLSNISGSVNDDINVHTGRLVRNAGLKTLVPGDGEIYSGGVDLFVSGTQRQLTEGGVIGVHSWCCYEDKTADQLPRDHAAHRSQLEYFTEMLPDTGTDFYFFTLEAAPFDGIHAMTAEELATYQLLTE